MRRVSLHFGASAEVSLLFRRGGMKMLWTLVVILLILWLLGVVTSYSLGGVVHLLLVIAIVIIVVNLVTGRRAL